MVNLDAIFFITQYNSDTYNTFTLIYIEHLLIFITILVYIPHTHDKEKIVIRMKNTRKQHRSCSSTCGINAHEKKAEIVDQVHLMKKKEKKRSPIKFSIIDWTSVTLNI